MLSAAAKPATIKSCQLALFRNGDSPEAVYEVELDYDEVPGEKVHKFRVVARPLPPCLAREDAVGPIENPSSRSTELELQPATTYSLKTETYFEEGGYEPLEGHQHEVQITTPGSEDGMHLLIRKLYK